MSLFVQPSLGFIVFVCFGVLVSCAVFHNHDFLGWSRNRNAGPLNVHISVCFLLPCMYEFHCVRVYVLVCLPMSPYLVLFPLIIPLRVSSLCPFIIPLPVYHPFAHLSSLCPLSSFCRLSFICALIMPLSVYHLFVCEHPFFVHLSSLYRLIILFPAYHPFTRLSTLSPLLIPSLCPLINHLHVNHPSACYSEK